MNSSSKIDMENTGSILNIELCRKLTFIFLIILIFPSIVCSCFILYHIIQKKEIRNRFNNHLIICIFLVYFIQVKICFIKIPLISNYSHRLHVIFLLHSCIYIMTTWQSPPIFFASIGSFYSLLLIYVPFN